MIGLPLPLPVKPPGLEVTVYEAMALPPFDTGTAKVTVAVELPAVAPPITGALGTVNGVTMLDAADSKPVPAMLTALTVKL